MAESMRDWEGAGASSTSTAISQKGFMLILTLSRITPVCQPEIPAGGVVRVCCCVQPQVVKQ